MASEPIQRQIDRFLDEVEAAIGDDRYPASERLARLKWQILHEKPREQPSARRSRTLPVQEPGGGRGDDR